MGVDVAPAVAQPSWPPLRLWIGASLLAGIIGALNPAAFILTPGYIAAVQRVFGVDYHLYDARMLSIFMLLMLAPCACANLACFPWLYCKLSGQKAVSMANYIKLAGLYLCITTPLTGLFVAIGAAILQAQPGQAINIASIGWDALFFGTLLAAFFPAALISGTGYVWFCDYMVNTDSTGHVIR